MAGRYGFLFCLMICVCEMIAPYPSVAQKVSAGREVPVLCYHQVRQLNKSDGKDSKAYTVTPDQFSAHIRMLHDSGFTPILPAQLYDYYTNGTPLPQRPVVITFDDNTHSQYTNALPVLNRYAYKATFFVMTVTIGKPGYMRAEQLKQLHNEGHTIGCHTWDHQDLRKLPAEQWPKQLDHPLQTLSGITGKPIYYFAYPYGTWNADAMTQLRQRHIRMAFILHTKSDEKQPLLTCRRLMVLNTWNGTALYMEMKRFLMP